jgi:N-methylhydantoinase A/oxoprolinase/acetone carboxylase beta subunit
MGFLIGVDTGGTYTDAVVIDEASHRILSSAKAITTKGDLAVGVSEAMNVAIGKLGSGFDPALISLVSVSTTLATNAVVEGHGTPVGVILIGFDSQMIERTGIAKAFPGILIERIAGGHNHNGEAVEPLDVAALSDAGRRMAPHVSAFAIASSFAVRNAAHEREAQEILARETGRPVTLSTELTSSLDAPRRALTAVLNARLISRISQLIVAVERAMAHHGISCPLTIVKGDGSLARAEQVAGRPIETVLSGPAASLVGARWLSGLDDFIMSDMGGTTTDIGVLRGGRPMVAEQGAEVGGWRTMVKAIDVHTIGLGGDSEVHLAMDGRVSLGPQRAVPVSLLGARYPEIISVLEADLAETDGGSLQGKFVVLPFGASAHGPVAGLSPREAEVLAQVGERPVPLRKIGVSSAAQRALASLRKKGLIQYCALTPSDVSHVLGLQDNWSAEAARLAVQLAVRFRDMRPGDEARIRSFCEEVWSRAVASSARIILDTAIGADSGRNLLLDAVCEGRPQLGLARFSASPVVPVVAVGGPVKVYYGEVGRRLGCEVVFAPNCDVANAVGAAAGLVAHRAVVTVEGDGNGVFRVHGGGRTALFSSGVQALGQAEMVARSEALRLAEGAGARAPRLSVAIEKSHLPDARDDEGLLMARVTAEAVGRPAA